MTGLLFATVECLLDEFSNEIALSLITAQCVDARLRAQSGTEMNCFVKKLWFGHPARHTGIAFYHQPPEPISR